MWAAVGCGWKRWVFERCCGRGRPRSGGNGFSMSLIHMGGAFRFARQTTIKEHVLKNRNATRIGIIFGLGAAGDAEGRTGARGAVADAESCSMGSRSARVSFTTGVVAIGELDKVSDEVSEKVEGNSAAELSLNRTDWPRTFLFTMSSTVSEMP